MAQIDYTRLGFEARVGIKAKICGKCGNVMDSVMLCPLRENRTNVKEKYVCWHCCWQCKYTVNAPGGRACGLKVKRLERQKAREEKKSKKKKVSFHSRDGEEDTASLFEY